MKNKIKQYFRTILVGAVLCAALSGVCIAQEYNFSNSKRFVDSNSYSYVCAATKTSQGNYAELKITAMYDADGNFASNYKQLYAKATHLGTETLVTKGTWCEVKIPKDYRAAGSYIKLYCMGHDPALDCYISGYWNVH